MYGKRRPAILNVSHHGMEAIRASYSTHYDSRGQFVLLFFSTRDICLYVLSFDDYGRTRVPMLLLSLCMFALSRIGIRLVVEFFIKATKFRFGLPPALKISRRRCLHHICLIFEISKLGLDAVSSLALTYSINRLRLCRLLGGKGVQENVERLVDLERSTGLLSNFAIMQKKNGEIASAAFCLQTRLWYTQKDAYSASIHHSARIQSLMSECGTTCDLCVTNVPSPLCGGKSSEQATLGNRGSLKTTGLLPVNVRQSMPSVHNYVI